MIKGHSFKSNLTEWLSYLESIHSVEIDLGLARINTVAKKLNIDFTHSTVITVAGTNGKGTTCAFLENAFLAQSLTCSVYSSLILSALMSVCGLTVVRLMIMP